MMTNRQAGMIDWRLPLPWLISGMIGVILTLGAVAFELRSNTNGISDLKSAISEIKLAQEKRDDSMARINQSNIETRATLANVQNEVGLLRGEIADVRRDMRQMQMDTLERRGRK